MTAAAAFAAWAGAAVIVLADGRRGLAVGIALVAAGLGTLAWTSANWFGGGALLLGGAICAIQLLRTGRQDWGLMPPGSTPRLTLAIVGGILSLWVAASVTIGPGPTLSFACLAVLALMAGRLLQARQATPVLTGAAGLALALAAASALGPGTGGSVPYVLGALIAAGALLLPTSEPRGA